MLAGPFAVSAATKAGRTEMMNHHPFASYLWGAVLRDMPMIFLQTAKFAGAAAKGGNALGCGQGGGGGGNVRNAMGDRRLAYI